MEFTLLVVLTFIIDRIKALMESPGGVTCAKAPPAIDPCMTAELPQSCKLCSDQHSRTSISLAPVAQPIRHAVVRTCPRSSSASSGFEASTAVLAITRCAHMAASPTVARRERSRARTDGAEDARRAATLASSVALSRATGPRSQVLKSSRQTHSRKPYPAPFLLGRVLHGSVGCVRPGKPRSSPARVRSSRCRRASTAHRTGLSGAVDPGPRPTSLHTARGVGGCEPAHKSGCEAAF